MSVLIRCCYCGDPFVPPPPPSSSLVSSSPVISTIGGCSAGCASGVAPRKYSLTVTSSAPGTCLALYKGHFICRSEGANECLRWGTDELAVNFVTSPCDPHDCSPALTWRWLINHKSYSGLSPSNIQATARRKSIGASSCEQFMNFEGVQGAATTVHDCMAAVTLSGTVSGSLWTLEIAPI